MNDGRPDFEPVVGRRYRRYKAPGLKARYIAYKLKALERYCLNFEFASLPQNSINSSAAVIITINKVYTPQNR